MLDCIYLATTFAEFWKSFPADRKLAYMACHFSLYGAGLSNIPTKLPPKSMLIVNDRIPALHHDPELMVQQLSQAVSALDCSCVLLDLERPGEDRAQAFCRECAATLPCPVGITPDYAKSLDCSVFLPPVPPDKAVKDHLAPYAGRKIWLEIANDALALTLTKDGCTAEDIPYAPLSPCFTEDALHCSYSQSICENSAEFTLWRTPQQLEALMQEARELGADTFVGLYQQLRIFL